MHLLRVEFDCPEVTLCGWQDVKIQLLTTSTLYERWDAVHISCIITFIYYYSVCNFKCASCSNNFTWHLKKKKKKRDFFSATKLGLH